MMFLIKSLTQTGLSFNYIKFKRLESVLLSYQLKKMLQEKKTIHSAHKHLANSTLKIIAIPLLTRTTPNHKITMRGLNSLKKALF